MGNNKQPKQQYNLRPSRVICDVCTQAASPSVIEQTNKANLWGVVMNFVSDKGQPLPVGVVICGRCYTLLKQIIVERLPEALRTEIVAKANSTAQGVNNKEGKSDVQE